MGASDPEETRPGRVAASDYSTMGLVNGRGQHDSDANILMKAGEPSYLQARSRCMGSENRVRLVSVHWQQGRFLTSRVQIRLGAAPQRIPFCRYAPVTPTERSMRCVMFCAAWVSLTLVSALPRRIRLCV